MYKYMALIICLPALLCANTVKNVCYSTEILPDFDENGIMERMHRDMFDSINDEDIGPLAWNFMFQPGVMSEEEEISGGKEKKMKIIKKYGSHNMGKKMECMKDMEKEALDFIKEYASPEQFEKIRSTKTPVYGRLLMHLMKQKMEMDMLKTADQERYELRKQIIKLELKSHEFTEKAKSAKDDAAKAKVKGEMMPVLNELFDLREKDREFEVKRLEKEIVKLKNLLIERKKHKSEIVKDHMDDLLEEDEYMKW